MSGKEGKRGFLLHVDLLLPFSQLPQIPVLCFNFFLLASPSRPPTLPCAQNSIVGHRLFNLHAWDQLKRSKVLTWDHFMNY